MGQNKAFKQWSSNNPFVLVGEIKLKFEYYQLFDKLIYSYRTTL
jgi:hypothetical protein